MRNNETTTAPPKEKEKQKTTQKPGIPNRNPRPGEKIKPKA